MDTPMKMPTKRLFRQESVSVNHAILYSLTIHPHKACMLNRRRYDKYNHDQQRALLGRIEACLRKKNPSIDLVEMHYEVAPSTGQIHFHALYRMPSIFQSTVTAYYRRLMDNNNERTLVPWRYLDLTTTDSQANWLEYIRKDSLLPSSV